MWSSSAAEPAEMAHTHTQKAVSWGSSEVNWHGGWKMKKKIELVSELEAIIAPHTHTHEW